MIMSRSISKSSEILNPQPISRKPMKPINLLVFDSDGVLTSGGAALPMARELISTLNARRFPYFVMSNGSFLCPQRKSDGYARMGLAIEAQRIIGSAQPLGEALTRVPRRYGRLFVISAEDPGPRLNMHGWEVDNSSPEIDGVLLLDDDLHWTAERLSRLLNRFLQRPDLPLIVPNPDLVYPNQPGRIFPTSGTWARLLCQLCAAHGVQLTPVFLGKPYDPIYRSLSVLLERDHPGLEPATIAMLGDSPETDILGANRQGWTSILIKTGNFRYGGHRAGNEADLCFEDLGAFRRAFLPTLSNG